MPQKTYSDPPGMPEGGRMTPAELKVVREFLGVTGDWLAGYLEVSPRTVRNWEQGTYAIPEQLSDLPEPGVVTYRDDEEYHAAHPEIGFPASWHRAVVARVAQEVPTPAIAFADAVAAEAPPHGRDRTAADRTTNEGVRR